MSRRRAVLVSFLVLGSLFLHVSHQLLFSYDDVNQSPLSPPIPVSSVPLQPHRNLAVQEEEKEEEMITNNQPPLPVTESVLLPDWQVMVISAATVSVPNACLFQNGATSSAKFAGVISGDRHVFICTLPPSARRLRPFFTPRISAAIRRVDNPPSATARWSRLVYESFSTPRDVIVFAKGINNRQTVSRPVSTLRCVFSGPSGAVEFTEVTSSAQEVFRCRHPAISADRVSLMIVDGEVSDIASVAVYNKPSNIPEETAKKLVCMSTMVYNVSKFLPEWVKYHAAIGVEKFVLYDNDSEGDLRSEVTRMFDENGLYDIRVVYWPWPKTQEASFSHSAATNRDTCHWMAFVDVDEFLYSPAWSGSSQPNSTMLSIILLPTVGQLSIDCFEFGPTGRKTHPKAGVTQGYTCRKRAENRHKSILRLDAVDDSLVNSIHHFRLKRGWKWEAKSIRDFRVNHYKFQAWEEFREKFRRRASSYVADWKEAVNAESKDRTPGLGFDPVEPEWWAQKMACEVNDTGLKELTGRWFGGVGPNAKMEWEE